MEKVKILKAVDIVNDSVSEYEGERPFLSTGDLNLSTITNLELHTFSEKPSRANQNVSSGDLILARMQGTVKVKLIKNEDENIIVSTGFLVLRPKSDTDNNYLFHLLKSSNFQNDKDKLCTGATQKAINNSNFEKLEIPLPNLATQQRIAAILDQADAIIQNNRAIVQKYDALTQSLFLDMFGDYRKNLNNFPKYLFDEIATKITDGDHLTPKREEKGYKLLSCRNIKNGYIDFSAGLDFVGESEFNRMFKRCNPEKGDILISCSGTIGRTTSIKIDEPFVLVRSAALVKPKRDLVDSLYLEYYLRTDYMQSVMKKSSNTSSQANLFTGPIKKLPIFLPPFKLQKQFAERVVVIEEQKQQAQLELAKSEELFQSLLQRAFNGELS